MQQLADSYVADSNCNNPPRGEQKTASQINAINISWKNKGRDDATVDSRHEENKMHVIRRENTGNGKDSPERRSNNARRKVQSSTQVGTDEATLMSILADGSL